MRAFHEKKLLVSTKLQPSFVSKGYINWKEATTSFSKHQASSCHREACEAVLSLPNQIIGNIQEVISNEVKEQKAMNRKMFLKILETLRFLAQQGLPLRGHAEVEGNFHQLLLRSIDCPEICEWIGKKTDKYMCHDIQNECLKIMALHIVRDIAKLIRESACYAIMADECTDLSNKEQFTICIRWVGHDLKDHEDFVGLCEVDSIEMLILSLMLSRIHYFV